MFRQWVAHQERPTTVCDPPMWLNCQLMAGSRAKMLSQRSLRDWCPVCCQTVQSGRAAAMRPCSKLLWTLIMSVVSLRVGRTCSTPLLSLHRRIRRHDFRYVRILLRDRSWNSMNCRLHASRIACTFSLGCFDIGTMRSRFSSTNRRTNSWRK